MRVILLHNVKAGERQWPAGKLKRLFAEHGHEVLYVSSKDADWEERLRQRAQAVVVAGGDGTVGQVALRLAERKLPFCVLPLGTANNIATSLGCDQPPKRIVAGLAQASNEKFDLGSINSCHGHGHFMESVGAGILTELMRKPEKENHTLSADQRLKQARKRLVSVVDEYPGCECEVRLDGKKTKGRFLAVEIMNIDRVGPNLLLAPEADSGDGWLDVVWITTRERAKLKAYLKSLMADESSPSPFKTRRCRRVDVRCQEACLHVDDEPSDIFTAEIHLEPSALSFLDWRPAVPLA